MSRNLQNLALLLLSSTVVVRGNPKLDDGGFVPSSMIYMEKSRQSHDQIAMPSQVDPQSEIPTKRDDTDANDIADRSQEPRFGFTNIGSTGSGYGATTYAPAKIDLGGLLLGAIIGVGSILIIPKLLYVLSGTYGHYARSEENGVAHIVTKMDDVLARHGIDSTSCMQRAVCTYSQHAASSTRDANQLNEEEEVSSFDKMFDAITTNQFFRTAMEGTAIQEAVEVGRNGRNCSKTYPHCGFSMETMLSLASNVITAVAAINTGPSTTPTVSGSL
ncbi:uncharacterized protein LOC128893858 [Hylaeus anthracinus]|uniref:uncharacterized protein LOC128879238 n=1 Tax=Hylaeus volcanicus TaxID=313075 RepID=UPI0023B781EB|nr:uncharacterized protein LOC128879238 [Hylaeus volcanicus]XP_054011115.1 uncharacterized protein LOC128893858 [Hylaeus anthracinus]